ncbi:penicillin-binding protein 2 [Burkholderia pseudomultivorans]|uniref:Peptidoglycan D,D-transpeptidase MrdA n=4 Tax=Burkholderia pseudomultivorans TaxID=1207504 RepID=A0ABU2E1J7_9BURK|nr:penicillin-binding protein 2 [Burkholderia pseudomultivorans]MDR8735324.1 Peptidoglycan D,D-transpeptidase MrdA [Burkholderia pseudomultivorans]MDR8741300.1 Peptidoglycan D,D-transpeptidase MrdA [Burkholderia pseudomultivorans]MDR8753746.1 Peptidoglycan D,D-transpeptidase MrdA [Burkholderia pseudomultivorans]MDR8777714.1 Peptidoglycan D,D-transpeptidase MrdA [Burkholderia pseudomultivorans]MDR8817256.1 Peptidoglycan D,D-transpeptidase MrdA [Burkholderia pseudomultivorans]
MTEFNDTQQQLSKFRLRVAAAGVFVFVCFGLLASRFFYLQLMQHGKYALQAEENRISVAPIVPNRGIITDRNGVILAKNYSAYTLEITPSKLDDTLDNTIDKLAEIVPIDARDRRRFKKLQEDSKNFESLPIRTRLTDAEVARFTAQRYRFPGVDVRARLFRQYPLGMTAAHVIGYIGRISKRDQDRIDAMSDDNDSDPENYDPRRDANNYKGTDYIGKIGVEQSYETDLHGLTGFEEVEVTAGGRPVRTLSRTQATPGNNLVLSLDIGLQQVAEQAFAGKRGALVAIEPKTGDVLAFVSSPSFDPNSFVDGIDQQTWDELNNSPDKPLLNRPLHGTYPPGSTYKPFMALAGLTLGKRTPGWGFQDPGYFTFGGHTFRNDVRSGQGWVDMNKAIMVSNDTYFYMLARDLGVNAIANFMKQFGFGQITGIDVQGEARGILPSTDWKKKAFKKPAQQKWFDGETISLGIGQGYNSFTILQLAHATATLANNGIVMKPHLVKEVEDPITRARHLTVPKESGVIPLKQADIDVVKRGMENVVENPSGTGYKIFRGAQYLAAGKTGTAQVFSLQGGNYKGHLLAEHLRDHALFIAYAPVDHPQIALALIVENGGWGAQAAGPIARRVLDFYLVDRQNPKNEAAAVAAAASATEPVNAPVIGDANKPATVAAGFTALPQPVVPSAASAADAASAASAPDASGAAAASAAQPAVASAAAPRPASLPPIRRPHRPRRPASEAQPLAAAPREDNHRATPAQQAANAGPAH